MQKTIEQRLQGLKAAGYIKPEDWKDETGAKRSSADVLEIGEERAAAPARNQRMQEELAETQRIIAERDTQAAALRAENAKIQQESAALRSGINPEERASTPENRVQRPGRPVHTSMSCGGNKSAAGQIAPSRRYGGNAKVGAEGRQIFEQYSALPEGAERHSFYRKHKATLRAHLAALS